MPTDEFFADASNRSKRRNRNWYYNNLLPVLEEQKVKHVREIDKSIALATELKQLLDEPREKQTVVPFHDVVPSEDFSLMKPIEPEVLALLYGSTEKGAAEKYLKKRNKKSPEDKFYFRESTNWDYGWQQKQSRLPARDVNRGRCAILRDTFYRKNNLAPDSPYYSQPAGGEFSICSQYQCNFTP